MSNQKTSPAVAFYDGLFNDCSTVCEAYGACGGHRKTMPCGCAWSARSGLRHRCGQCYLICRDRKDQGLGGGYSFASHLFRGKMIEQLKLQQGTRPHQDPLFIPMNTGMLVGDVRLPLKYAAADVNTLFRTRKFKGAELKANFTSHDDARHHLKVDKECQLVGVLNGKDIHLESFWGMGEVKRIQSFSNLRNAGFLSMTGATFSVAALTTEGTPTPFAHNVAMMMRHHKVADEIQASHLTSIPNMYWLDRDEREMNRWAEWLIKNPSIHSVSREFTLTKKPEAALPKLGEMIHVLNLTGRSFHVYIVGTGVTTGSMFLQALNRSGHTGTIITSAPIYDARLNAMRYRLKDDGSIAREKCLDLPYNELIWNNLSVFEEAMLHAVKGTESEQRFVPNLLGKEFSAVSRGAFIEI